MLIQQGPLLIILYDSYTLIFCKSDFAIACITGYGKLLQSVFLDEFSLSSIRKLYETFDVDRSLVFIIKTTGKTHKRFMNRFMNQFMNRIPRNMTKIVISWDSASNLPTVDPHGLTGFCRWRAFWHFEIIRVRNC